MYQVSIFPDFDNNCQQELAKGMHQSIPFHVFHFLQFVIQFLIMMDSYKQK